MTHHPMLGDDSYPMIDNLPQHWELLTRKDLDDYVKLRTTFYDKMRLLNKGSRIDTFIYQLTIVRNFIERNDKDDWKRGLVCGILFLDNSIAIHIQQLRLLLGKCKSSINGSLQQIGFAAHPQGSPVNDSLYEKVPIFKSHHSEVKKWTVRDFSGNMQTIFEKYDTKGFDIPIKEEENQDEEESVLESDSGEKSKELALLEQKELPKVIPVIERPKNYRVITPPNINPLFNVPVKFRTKFIKTNPPPIIIRTVL